MFASLAVEIGVYNVKGDNISESNVKTEDGGNVVPGPD
jgi:hypothetical protein